VVRKSAQIHSSRFGPNSYQRSATSWAKKAKGVVVPTSWRVRAR